MNVFLSCLFTFCDTNKKVFLHLLLAALTFMIELTGSSYIGYCPANPFLPKILKLSGRLATVVIVIRIIKVHWYYQQQDTPNLLFRCLFKFLDILFVLSFIKLVESLYTLEQSYGPPRYVYCDVFFYNFVWKVTSVSLPFVVFFVFKLGQ
ncbi:hypothetical protein NPIL_417471 [Nephila pilipes]|uniref:Uncharacterized protein n=1 Tax=Nephila pilipes TaxID=299642 RepID=A0A8X6MS72_NEPPI|nr:hypothetical protein NPIL_417471 [Nephila pilipes]